MSAAEGSSGFQQYFAKEHLPKTVFFLVVIVVIIRMLMKSTTTTTQQEHGSVGMRRTLNEGLNDNGGFTTSVDPSKVAQVKAFVANAHDDNAIAAALIASGHDTNRAAEILLKLESSKNK